MKIGKNNEILEATMAELKTIWKKNGWDEDYSFDRYVEIQTKHNGVKIKKTLGKNAVSVDETAAAKEKDIADTKPELRKLKRLLS